MQHRVFLPGLALLLAGSLLLTGCASQYGAQKTKVNYYPQCYQPVAQLRQDENKTYLLVAHNGIARVVESYFHDMTNEEYAAAGIKNCELVEYRFE